MPWLLPDKMSWFLSSSNASHVFLDCDWWNINTRQIGSRSTLYSYHRLYPLPILSLSISKHQTYKPVFWRPKENLCRLVRTENTSCFLCPPLMFRFKFRMPLFKCIPSSLDMVAAASFQTDGDIYHTFLCDKCQHSCLLSHRGLFLKLHCRLPEGHCHPAERKEGKLVEIDLCLLATPLSVSYLVPTQSA